MVPETAAGMVVEAVGQMKVRGHPHCLVRDQFIHFNMIKKVKFHQPSSNLTCSFSDTNMAVAVCVDSSPLFSIITLTEPTESGGHGATGDDAR